MDCLSDRDVAALLACELDLDDLRRVCRHLLSGCRGCRLRLIEAVPPDLLWNRNAAEPDEVYDPCIDRARKRVRRLEPRLRQDKERLERGVALVREKKFGGCTWPERQSFWSVHAEVLLQRSFDLRYSQPWEMVRLAELAQKILDDKDFHPRYGEALHLDRRARAWAELANAYRVVEWFEKAEAALETARSLLEQGTGDPMLEAYIDEVEASLLKAQRRLDEAIRLLDWVYRAYTRFGERHLAGRTLMSRGIVLWLQKRSSESIRSLRRAISLMDGARDPQLVATAHHAILKTLVDSGRWAEAGKALLESGLRQKFADDPLNLLRLRWVEAKILAGHGRLEDAEKALAEVRAGFYEHRLAYVAAVAGLDQAEVMLRQSKEVLGLASDILARFRQHATHPEAIYALSAYEVVCEEKAANVTVTQRIRDFVDRLQDNPRTRFEVGLLYGCWG